MATAEVHLVFRVLLEDDGNIGQDLLLCEINTGGFELILGYPENKRPIQDFISESLMEFTNDVGNFLPENVEICKEYQILFECIGDFSVWGFYDYFGEYDEESEFELKQWSIDFAEPWESE